jgi:uncharacterized protein YqhQ
MIRKVLRNLVVNKKYRGALRGLSRIFIIVGVIWIISFPYIARKVFTSENALNNEFLGSLFREDHEIYAKFKQYQDRLQNYKEDSISMS